MKISRLINGLSLINDFKLLIMRIKFGGEGRVINTYLISKSCNFQKCVRLEYGCRLLSNCSIGKYSYLRNGSVLWHRSKIGNYCSIGENVSIGVPIHPTNFLSTSPHIYQDSIFNLGGEYWPKDDIKEGAIVGSDVWIGNNAVIMSGLRIGNGAVIGAGSVITKNVPPFAIVGGVPGKIIRFRFDEKTAMAIQNSNWWDLDKDELLDKEFIFNFDKL